MSLCKVNEKKKAFYGTHLIAHTSFKIVLELRWYEFSWTNFNTYINYFQLQVKRVQIWIYANLYCNNFYHFFYNVLIQIKPDIVGKHNYCLFIIIIIIKQSYIFLEFTSCFL